MNRRVLVGFGQLWIDFVKCDTKGQSLFVLFVMHIILMSEHVIIICYVQGKTRKTAQKIVSLLLSRVTTSKIG